MCIADVAYRKKKKKASCEHMPHPLHTHSTGSFCHLYHLDQLWWWASRLAALHLDGLQGCGWWCCSRTHETLTSLPPALRGSQGSQWIQLLKRKGTVKESCPQLQFCFKRELLGFKHYTAVELRHGSNAASSHLSGEAGCGFSCCASLPRGSDADLEPLIHWWQHPRFCATASSWSLMAVYSVRASYVWLLLDTFFHFPSICCRAGFAVSCC